MSGPHYEKHREKYLAQSRNWKLENPGRYLISQTKHGAKRRGYEFTISDEELLEVLAPMMCAKTGVPLRWTDGTGKKNNPFAPSLDRIDNSKGYVVGNVQLVSSSYNLAKHVWSDDQMHEMAVHLTRKKRLDSLV